MEYDSIYEQIAKGAIIPSKATWYKKRQKKASIFLNLETHKLKALFARFLTMKE